MGDADKLTRYQKQMKSKQGQSAVRLQGQLEKKVGGTRERGERTEIRLNGDKIDSIFGFDRMKEGLPRVGWLLNYLPITMPDETGIEKSGMDLYFIERGSEAEGGGGNFKATVFFEPYLYLDVSDPRRMMEIANHLLKRFEGCKVQPVEREDLDLPNHLSGKKHPFLKLSFGTVSELMDAKSQLRPIITANQKRLASAEDYLFSGNNDDALVSYLGNNSGGDIWEDTTTTTNSAAAIVSSRTSSNNATSVNAAAAAAIATDPLSYLIDFREHDVPYGVRASIDLDLRIGAWYKVTPEYGSECCVVQKQAEILELCEPRILAFDIECEKSPLKFPNAEVDRIFMISYMVKNQGYLIINRDVVSEDIEDFEYTPKPTFPGPFKVFNEKDEEAVLRKFVSHIQELKPHVIVTYNGDKFDWPYVETRCKKYTYLNLYSHLGIRSTAQPAATVNKDGTPVAAALFSDNEYTGRCMIHLDAFCWVQRDSYLPQGNQGLKAVTKYKLGYDPVEVDPEDMLNFARERPHHMASYSVSDAVATYYLYTTYVHNFIFSLSTIIPMGGEDVLRKGSGTLCEMLLMVEAYNGNIVCPNKQVDPLESFHEGHLLESETYIGGHVECLEAGVFRADIPAKFNLVPSALQQLIHNIDRDLTFTLEVEHGMQRSDAVNYDEVRQQIVSKLEMLRDSPHREESPIIYHLDVGAMYPNIILTNRLQPSAMVSTSDCASCVYNKAENQCKRPMTWTWRGDFSPTSFSEYQSVKRQLEYERINTPNGNNNNNYNKNNTAAGVGGGNLNVRTFSELSEREQTALIRTRLKAYSSRVYRKTKVTSVEQRTDTVCMRENSFYVDTVKAFRDRRYDYKLFTKEWKNKKVSADKKGDAVARKVAEDMEVLMDSLQLAHKCILNSFYGYVMRKGARWRSMEMAGIVTHTGAALIKQARELVEQVGRPLELDTDGIWCILPTSFPQDFKIKMKDGSTVKVGYPCAMLNADVHENYTNHQYQELQKTDNKSIKYATHSECSIFFELDGPYKAMVLPASPEEGKLLKKKYVVFNFNGTIAELKGFELKRRGELELVKIFQSQVFEHFLAGDTLSECYSAVGAIANQWLDVLDEQGTSMDDEELLELISERKTISKTVEDYEGRKSTSLTTAARLADFLGADMVRDKGLNCNLVISRLPAGAPVTERAIPVAIFSCESTIRKFFLRKWLKDSSLECDDFRHLIDWNYYKERLGKSIQKIITIPAGLQRIGNPCPRVEHPVWLTRSIQERNSGRKQLSILNSFSNMRVANEAAAAAAAAQTASSSVAAPRLLSAGADRPVKSILAGDSSSSNNSNRQPKKRVRILLEGEELPEEEQEQQSSAVQEIGDLEDFGSSSPGGTVSRTGLVRVTNLRPTTTTNTAANTTNTTTDVAGSDSAEGTSAESTDITNTDEITTKVSIIALNELPDGHATTTEFNAWLKDRKSRWAASRAAKKAQRAELARYGSNRSAVGTGGNTGGPLVKKNVGVADFVRNASLAASMGFWQVIEIQETDIAGEFVVWAMTAPTQLQRLNVVIPRILYVNVTAAGKDAQAAAVGLGGVRIRKDLPHGKQCRELFEVSIPERKFQRNERALNLFLCDAQVEGVYESQVPLWLRGILGMGCVSTVNSRTSSTNNRYYKLQDIDLVHTQSHPYLTHHTAHYRRIYIYYAADRTRVSGDVGIVALFQLESSNYEQLQLETTLLQQRLENIPQNSGHVASDLQAMPLSGKAYVWLVSRGANLEKAPFKRIYRKFQPSETADVKFVQNYVTTLAQAWTMCNERLTLYQRERHGPTIVIVQGGAGTDTTSTAAANNNNTNAKVSNTTSTSGVGMDARQWRHVLPSLHDYPLAVMPANSLDSLFPAIGWQLFCAERMVQRFLIFPRWFDDRLTAARYAHIPLCNLGTDALTTMIDVTFSRQLLHNRHLLWCSEGTGPDLGKGNSTNELLDIWSEALKEPVINVPGVYRGACVELDLYGLAVCAIMSSGELDAEGLTTLALAGGGSGSGGSGGAAGAMAQNAGNNASTDSDDEDADNHHSGSSAFAGAAGVNDGPINVLLEGIENTSDASCARAFNIFKAMIAKCIEEVSSSHSTTPSSSTGTSTDGTAGIADSILTAVYRYLCGYGNGLLSDPLLHRVIYGLMTKLFQKLVGGLRRLGTKVVYADFGRIIISTDKHDFASAREYVEFILSALGNKPTFAYLQVSVKAYWEQMCWLGPENWGALPLNVPTTTSADTTADSIDMTGADAEAEAEAEVVEVSGLHREPAMDEAVEEDTEEDGSDIDDSSHRSPKKKTAASPVKKVHPKKTTTKPSKGSKDKSAESDDEEGEFDFLDDINNGSDNLASIKKYFGHKGGNSAPSATAKTAKKSKVSKFVSSKHTTSKDSGSVNKNNSKHRHSSGGYSSGDNSDTDLEEGGYGNSARYDQDYGADYADQSFESDMDSQAGDHNTDHNSNNYNQQLQAHWNLATYLPDAAAEFFHWVIEEYLQQYKAKREQLLMIRQHALNSHDSGTFTTTSGNGTGDLEASDGDVSMVALNRQTSETSELSSLYTEVLLDDGGIDRKVSEYMQTLLRERFTNKMLEIVDELQLAYSHHDLVRGAGSVFPVRAGSHLQLTSPALEFVKAATHVMALDPLLAQEVASLRRLLLTQLRVREFSVDSVFQDPCLSYTLRDVICSYCSTCRDLDLLRDASLTCEDPAQRWRCRHCQNRINTEEVENRLLEAVDKLNASYLLQDFRCRSSHRVSRRLGTAVSDLCDPLVMDVSRDEALNRLKVLRQVATFHKFSLLQTAVEELMV